MELKDKIDEIDLYISQEKFEIALKKINQLKNKKIDPIELLIRKIRINYLQRNYLIALELIEKLRSLDPKDLNFQILNLDIAIKAKNIAKSEALLFSLEGKVIDEDLIGFKIQFYKLTKEYQKAADLLKTKIGKNKDLDKGIFFELGFLLNANKKFDEALIFYTKALQIDNDSYEVFYNMGITLSNLGKYDEAINSFQIALNIDSSDQKIYQELSGQYQNKNDFSMAEKILDDAIDKFENNANLKCIKAFLYIYKNNKQGATNIYDELIETNPEFIRTYCDKSYLLLASGEYQEGWKYYQYRQRLTHEYLCDDTKVKNITNLEKGISIDILPEQGIGDLIFHSRLLQKIKLQNRITVYTDIRLIKVLQENYDNINFIDQKLYKYNAHNLSLNIASIARFYIHDDNDINFKNYLVEKNLDIKKNIIGISWFSGNQSWGQEKSMPLDYFKKIKLTSNQKFYNLQYGDCENEIKEFNQNNGNRIIDNKTLDKYNDIYGLCKDIQDCEYIITVSNITAHLAGCLGKKCFLMLPKHLGKMWYWASKMHQSIWYPSVTVIPQENHETWEDSIDKLNDLIRYIAN